MDDFGNKKDNVMNPCTEFEELQYMINTSEYPLWMADLAKKGSTTKSRSAFKASD